MKCFAGIKSMKREILLFGPNKAIQKQAITRMVVLSSCAKFKVQMIFGTFSMYIHIHAINY